MATVTATLAPGAGYANITLTSWAGDAAFATTPVAGGQLEHISQITVSASGVISAPPGTYAITYIAPDGSSETIEHTIVVTAKVISNLVVTTPSYNTIAVGAFTGEFFGTLYGYASSNATEDAATVKTQAQASTVINAYGKKVNLQLPPGDYYAHVVYEGITGLLSNVLSSALITLIDITENSTTSATLSGGADYTTATLASNFNASTSAFQNWTGGNPAAGWQIETLTADGWFDSQGQYWKAAGVADGIQDVWVIQPDGTSTAEEFDTTGLSTFGVVEAPRGTWAIGTITKTQTTASLTPIYSLGDASSFERTLNGTDWTVFSGTISLTGLTEGANYPNAAVRAVNSVGPGASASFEFTTESEVVVTPETSTIAMFLDNLPDGTHETVILDSVNDVVLFSGNLVWTGEARSYVLDLVPGSIVVYYVIGATEGGLQRGVTA